MEAQIVSRWPGRDLELAVSEKLLAELKPELAYRKVRRRVKQEEAEAIVALLRRGGRLGADPAKPARRSADPGDDYLLALADGLPIHMPRAFLDASSQAPTMS